LKIKKKKTEMDVHVILIYKIIKLAQKHFLGYIVGTKKPN
jgi:hypothetical protein